MNKSIIVLMIMGTIVATMTTSITSEVFAAKIKGSDRGEVLIRTDSKDKISNKGGDDTNFGYNGDDKIHSGKR